MSTYLYKYILETHDFRVKIHERTCQLYVSCNCALTHLVMEFVGVVNYNKDIRTFQLRI